MNGKAKFKVGDRVKSIFDEIRGKKGVILGENPESYGCYAVLYDEGQQTGNHLCPITYKGTPCNSSSENNLELIEELQPTYQKLTPKVGDKFRVVKKMRYLNDIKIWEVIEMSSYKYTTDGSCLSGVDNYLTTEYLEPVEEPLAVNANKEAIFEVVRTNWEHLADCCIGVDFASIKPGQIIKSKAVKKTITQKTMSFIKRLTQSAEDKTLAKAYFTDSCGDLTSTGKEALTSLVFAEKKAELVKLAEEVIAESKE